MSVAQFLVTAAISILVTLPAVLLIPRARQSPAFDRVLWIGTALMAFIGAWFALGNVAGLDVLLIGEVSLVPALIGAAVGAFLLNGLLWSMDFFSRPQIEEDWALEESNEHQDSAAADAGEEEHVGDDATRPGQEQ